MTLDLFCLFQVTFLSLRYVLYVRIKLIFSFLTSLLLLSTLSCSSTKETLNITTHRIEKCPGEIVPTNLKVDCYRYENGDSSTAFALLKSSKKGKEPVLFLHGGPGGRALKDRHIWLSPKSKILDSHDLILLDQKGSGESEPSLDCLETDEGLNGESISACRARLSAQGINFSAYQIEKIAEEIVDLRVSLGIKKWNLYGVSFGSRIALELMNIDGTSVNTVVLDSPLPSHVPAYDSLPQASERAINLTLDKCEERKECDFSLLTQPILDCSYIKNQISNCLEDLLRQLDESPVTYSDGNAVISIDDSVFALELVNTLAHPEGVSVVPRAVMLALDGKIAEAMNSLFTINVEGYSKGDKLSEGAQFSSECLDELPKNNPSIESYQTSLASALSERERVLQEICKIWINVSPSSNEPSVNPKSFDSKALILSGSLDPITPSEWAVKTKEILPNAILVIRDEWTHAPSLSDPCAKELVSHFFSTGHLKSNTSSC